MLYDVHKRAKDIGDIIIFEWSQDQVIIILKLVWSMS